nr:LCP family protein [Corynebacterium sp. c6VSa_13]
MYRPVRDIQAPPTAAPTIRQAGPASVKTVLTVLSVLVLVVSALGYYSVGQLGSQIASAGNLQLGGGKGVKGHGADGAVDILLVGSDSRTDAQGNPLSEEELAALNAGVEDGALNTDTMMVVRVPNDGTSATAVSIPRDTYIHDANYGNLKINGVFSSYKNTKKEQLQEQGDTDTRRIERESNQAGRAGLIKAVTDLTGIEVDHYAEIGLLGFVLLTDAVGGVDVCLNQATSDEFSGANFHAGRQSLDGRQALAYVRQRHGLPRGDLDRVVRQQAFMASMVNKVLSAGTMANPSRLNEMRSAVERSVVLDDDLDVMSFATQLSNLAGGNVVFNTIPVTSIDGVGDYGESIVTVDRDEVHRYMRTLLGEDSTPTPDASNPDAQGDGDGDGGQPLNAVTVYNAGTIPGLAASVAQIVRSSGHPVGDVTNAPAGVYTYSQIVAANDTDPSVQRLSRDLGNLPITVDASQAPGTAIVVTADDYAGPQAAPEETHSPLPEDTVGQPGADFGEAEVAPEIDAGGNGPRCVN